MCLHSASIGSSCKHKTWLLAALSDKKSSITYEIQKKTPYNTLKVSIASILSKSKQRPQEWVIQFSSFDPVLAFKEQPLVSVLAS